MTRINIGIAGYMGSGKSTCVSYLSQCGGVVVDADAIAKEMMNSDAEIKSKLVEHFGTGILSDGTINYTVLGSIAFSSLENLTRLNAIVHPPLLKRLHSIITSKEAPLGICDAALIPYWRIEEWFDVLLWIHASREIRFERLLQKGEVSSEDLKNRIVLQETLFSKPTAGLWVSVSNEGTREEFEKEIAGNSSLDCTSFSFSKD